MKKYKLVGRKKEKVVKVSKDVEIGGKKIIIIAGPCAVENEEQILESAMTVKKLGIKILRGGAFKPRTSPYSFQGLGEEGLKLLAKAREKTNLLIATEVMAPHQVKLVAKYADILQIGARGMQNFPLLKEVGKVKKPVLLKRGIAATLDEFLLAAEYILLGGNEKVILCERGIRTFCQYSRNTLDLNIIPAVKKITSLPILVDPSHGTGRKDLIASMSKAAIAAGADGLMIEVHPTPEEALSDKEQALTPQEFSETLKELKLVAKAVGREL